MQNILTVSTQRHDYPIVISDDGRDFDFERFIGAKQVLIVSNQTVAPLYLSALEVRLQAFEVVSLALPDGEEFKCQESINAIYDVLMQHQFGRDCTLIALGGGVIGDMVGFAAASFMRGVNFIQMPTTLLAQVDSSVGGKTGINHALGKNMIGAFWQPVAVFADLTTFTTLPVREFNAGMAEVIKYALIMDINFLHWLDEHKALIKAQNLAIVRQMVYRCCQYKAQIVHEDEKEMGRRALLNFGHTFGHAIETHEGYGQWLHGEAVSVGMVQAAKLSNKLGLIGCDDVQIIINILRYFDLPVIPPKIHADVFLKLMGHDKKVKHGLLHFVLLKQLGCAFVSADVADETVIDLIESSFDVD